ncbi:MAG: GtrA family protein [Lactobacillales bacterium]|nr:GtrA family protein [Lactobacillales bacterium]
MQSSRNSAKEIVRYLIVGVLTTIVYFVARFTVVHFSSSPIFSVIVGQVAAILFAFFASKFFVFEQQKEEKSAWIQFIQFVIGRLLVFVLDLLITYIFVEKFASTIIQFFRLNHLNYESFPFNIPVISGFIGTPVLLNTFFWAMLMQVLAIVLNYIISKFFVFSKGDESTH